MTRLDSRYKITLPIQMVKLMVVFTDSLFLSERTVLDNTTLNYYSRPRVQKFPPQEFGNFENAKIFSCAETEASGKREESQRKYHQGLYSLSAVAFFHALFTFFATIEKLENKVIIYY